MDYSTLYENKRRGTFDFPIELYQVDRFFPRYQMPFHWHLEYEIILIRQGVFDLTLDGVSYSMKPGDAGFWGGGVIHGGVPHECVYASIVFDLDAFLKDTPVHSKEAGKFLDSHNGKFYIFPKESPGAGLITAIVNAMSEEKTGYEWCTIGLMWQLIGTIVNSDIHTDPLHAPMETDTLKTLLSYIKLNYSKPISLTDLSHQVGMSPKYFCRYFSRVTGKSPIDYLNYYRTEIAGELLRMTSKSITDISLSCGFNDISYFSRTFTKYKGVSPSRYRKGKLPSF